MTHHVVTYVYQPKCRQCGKAGSKVCDTIYTDEPYNGNQIVIKRQKFQIGTRAEYETTVWDGETYKLNAGKFCTSRCAINWANENAMQPEENQ